MIMLLIPLVILFYSIHAVRTSKVGAESMWGLPLIISGFASMLIVIILWGVHSDASKQIELHGKLKEQVSSMTAVTLENVSVILKIQEMNEDLRRSKIKNKNSFYEWFYPDTFCELEPISLERIGNILKGAVLSE